MGTPADGVRSRVAQRKARTNGRFLEVARRLFPEKGIYWAKIDDIWGGEAACRKNVKSAV